MATHHRWMLALAVAAALGAGCANRAEAPQESELSKEAVEAPSAQSFGGMAHDAAPSRNAAPGAPATEGVAKPKAEAKDARSEAALSRYIIRHANLGLEVEHVRETMDRIGAIAKAAGGFVSDANLQANEGQPPSATVTLRVPAGRFDGLIDRVSGLGTLRTKQVTGEDVTTEFVDTQARVRNLQKQEGQLLKLLERTGKLSDILEVERELARVRGEIEQSQARVRHLSALVELATIEIAVSEKRQVANASPWQLPTVWENAWQNAQAQLAGAIADLVRGFVWLVGYVLPLLVPALIAYGLAGWWLRKLLAPRWLSEARFILVWAAVGVALVGVWFPPVFGWVAVVGLVALVLWLAVGLWGRFGRRREEA